MSTGWERSSFMRATIKFTGFLFALLPISGHTLVKFKVGAEFNDMPVMVIVSTSVKGLHNGCTSEAHKPVLVSNSDMHSIQPPFAAPLLFSTVGVKFLHPGYLLVDIAVPGYSAVAGIVDMGTLHLRPVDDLLTYVCDGIPAREAARCAGEQ